ncbi:MAG: AarF/ABC1/UbiB kinase family protein [Syntrophomonadaceae bacterium]
MRLNPFQRLAHIPRYREVANILVKHGFGFIFDRISPGKLKKAEQQELRGVSAARQLREAFEELGPTYVKLGQLLSTRPDLVAPEFIREFEKLQDDVPPISYAEVSSVCAGEGIDIDEAFAYFNHEPLAAASIAQVHEAVLKDGQKVVVKVQRPGIDRQIKTDLQILMEIARILEKRTDWGQLYRVTEIVDELGEAIINEVDFTKEARNADIFYNNFRKHEHVIIPKVYWDYSSKKILTLEYVEGVKISDPVGLKKAHYNSEKIATHLVEALFKQVYEYGFFHADPHPGNLAITEGEKIIFYDFGQVGVIDRLTREKAMDLLVGMMKYDVNGVARALLDIGIGTQSINQAEFRREISRLQQKYYGLPLSQINIGEALSELIALSLYFRVRVPPELSLVVKMIMTIERIISQLDPQLSIVDIAQPYGKRLLRKRFAPEQLKESAESVLMDYAAVARTLPRDVDNVLKMIEAGEIKIHMEHENLRRFTNKIDILSNRLSLAIIIASIIIGTSLVVGQGSSKLFSRIPLVEVGFFAAVFLGLVLAYSIFKRGRF